jgi:transposase
LAASTTQPHALVQRARILLACADGKGSELVAREVGCESRTVRKWKSRFRAQPTVDALHDLPRAGRPAQVSVATRCKVVELACRRPDEKLAPFRDVWTRKALADATEAETGTRLSPSEIGRILMGNRLRPHRVRYWLNCKDLNFGPKAEVICDLYLTPPPDAVVLSVDEKPVQAVGRKHPYKVGPDGEVRKEYEYIRRGTCCLLAAFDVRSGKVVANVVARRTAEATVAFVESLATLYPGKQVYIVWDNLNTHLDGPTRRWTAFNERSTSATGTAFTSCTRRFTHRG